MSNDVVIKLSEAEALVLFELLSGWFDERPGESPAMPIMLDAERAVLECVVIPELERTLVAHFATDYEEQVSWAHQDVLQRHLSG